MWSFIKKSKKYKLILGILLFPFLMILLTICTHILLDAGILLGSFIRKSISM
ncbi:MAG: hypothetical protein PHN72_02755 [Bacilli bacterium]|nr:hypothetical protein [Bacilli bacterium]